MTDRQSVLTVSGCYQHLSPKGESEGRDPFLWRWELTPLGSVCALNKQTSGFIEKHMLFISDALFHLDQRILTFL